MTKQLPEQDTLPYVFSTFSALPTLGPKSTSTYLKSDAQSVWQRKAAEYTSRGNPNITRPAKRKRENGEAGHEQPKEKEPAGYRTIIFHPGATTLLVGRASDYEPVRIPMVVARRKRIPLKIPSTSGAQSEGEVEEPVARGLEMEGVKLEREAATAAAGQEREAIPDPTEEEPIDGLVSNLRHVLRERSRLQKLRGIPNGHILAKNWNDSSQAETIKEFNDIGRVEWREDVKEDVLVGHETDLLSPYLPYIFNHPHSQRRFITDRPTAAITNDIQTLFTTALKKNLKINISELEDYNAMLIVPDLAEKEYVREMVGMLVDGLGFGLISVQQESLSASIGAGLSTACIIDIGSSMTSIACIEDGQLLSETRHVLSYGGDDVTRFFTQLCLKSSFPYKDVDLSRSWDWDLMQGMKERYCTLVEAQVGLNVHDFSVRPPPGTQKLPTKKYSFRTFDETILAPMCLFDPRVIDFDQKRPMKSNTSSLDIDDNLSLPTDLSTNAAVFSTWHLRPVPTPTPPQPMPEEDPAATASSSLMGEHLKSVVGSDAGSRQPTPAPEAAPALGFDIVEEASKVPLDVAIANAIMCCANEEKVKKMCGSLVLCGGTAQIPGFGEALQSRIFPILSSRYLSVKEVQVIPSPRDIDPRILAWKGVSVLSRLEVVTEMWVGKKEWQDFGMRALKERWLV